LPGTTPTKKKKCADHLGATERRKSAAQPDPVQDRRGGKKTETAQRKKEKKKKKAAAESNLPLEKRGGIPEVAPKGFESGKVGHEEEKGLATAGGKTPYKVAARREEGETKRQGPGNRCE